MFLSSSYILLLMKKSASNSDEIEINGQKYGNTQFVKYNNQISIPVPSGGRYFLENVDVDSFRVLDSQNYSDRSTLIVGLDKNSVYFGNIRIPDLNPNKLKVIGNGYYTDGTNTYFCSDMSERNQNLSSPMEIFQTLIYAFSKTKKPQSYIYPYKKVETDKKIIAIFKPNVYSRFVNFKDQYIEAFNEADYTYLTKVESNREKYEDYVGYDSNIITDVCSNCSFVMSLGYCFLILSLYHIS